VLLSQTKKDFHSYGLSGGPAAKLVQAIEALKSGTFSLSFNSNPD
jgi:hypothetical protein